MSTPSEVIDALESRYRGMLEAAAAEVGSRRRAVEDKERERDRLIIDSAPILRRETAARSAGLSVSRVEQIIGGAS